MTSRKIKAGIIGCGGISHFHMQNMFQAQNTEVVALCDPLENSVKQAVRLITDAGYAVPPNEPDIDRFLANYEMDAVLIATPHTMHHDHTLAALEAGLDVLLEKPMVVNTEEALSLIEARDRTGRTLVVAFQGSLSPLIRQASEGLRRGDYGSLLSVSATIWQHWGELAKGTWRQVPELSGGGFIFDTGAHMLNTVADLVGQDFVEVAAWMDDYGRPVETLSVAIAKLASGALVTLHGCGETIPSCSSDIKVFCTEAILNTCAWGRSLSIQKAGRKRARRVPFPPASSVWDTFVQVRNGEIKNPSPPEVGLRMIRLYDAICQSAAQDGRIVKIEP
jgi:predicted dehydrogenase